jgi:elongation factor Ts
MVNKVKELRQRTNCGIVDCKQALDEANGDLEAAILWLRKKGKATAAKKAERATAEGVIGSYIHSNHKVGVLVSLYCETDFVARNERFQGLARDLALHIAAADPLALKPEDIPADLIDAEKAIALEQATSSGKPVAIQEKMVEGRLKKFTSERSLLTQPFVKNPDKTVADLINEAIGELGENISVGAFTRLSI